MLNSAQLYIEQFYPDFGGSKISLRLDIHFYGTAFPPKSELVQI